MGCMRAEARTTCRATSVGMQPSRSEPFRALLTGRILRRWLSACVVCCTLGLTAASSAQVVQKPEANFDVGYTPDCAAMGQYYPTDITENAIVDAMVCRQRQQWLSPAVARTYLRACGADVNALVAQLRAEGNPSIMSNIMDAGAGYVRGLRERKSAAEVEEYARQNYYNFSSPLGECLRRFRLQELAVAAAPSAATSAPPPPAAPIVNAPPPPADTPERKAALSAIDEVLAAANKPPVKPAPVPPRIQVVSNSGTRCMDVAVVNARLDEKKEYWSYTYRVRNTCPTPQLFVAEINEYGGGPLAPAFDFIFGHSGSWWTWSHQEQPPGLGFTPSDPRGSGSPPLAARAVIDHPFGSRSVRETEPIYLWLATCDGYADASESVANTLFRAAPLLALDNRVRCVPNKKLR